MNKFNNHGFWLEVYESYLKVTKSALNHVIVKHGFEAETHLITLTVDIYHNSSFTTKQKMLWSKIAVVVSSVLVTVASLFVAWMGKAGLNSYIVLLIFQWLLNIYKQNLLDRHVLSNKR